MIGPIYDGTLCQMSLTADMSRCKRKRAANIETFVSELLKEKGGDFAFCKLAKNSFIEVKLERRFGSTLKSMTRTYPIGKIRSLKHLVARKKARPTF
jgi:hypothetical protein